MIRIAIVEDEQMYASTLMEYLHRYEQEQKETFEITWFSDGDEIVEGYLAKWDIICMDVQMRFMDGMSAAEQIRKVDTEVVIIFITNMKQYALRGYTVDALDYVVKPVTYFAFSQRLAKAIGRMKRRTQRMITLQIKGGMVRIEVSDIYYIESQRHTMIYHTGQGIFETSQTMKDVEEKLEADHFFRGNKGYLINLAHVQGVKDNCAIVRGEELMLSRGRKGPFMEALTDYWSEVR